MTDAVLQHPLWPDAAPARNDMPLSAAPSAAATRRNWIAVACAQHARRGCATPGAGYMQVCHGKVAPLQRIRPGDRVAYYAPTVTMGGKDRLQAFVSIGIVLPGPPYAFDMGGGTWPMCLRVRRRLRRCWTRWSLWTTASAGAASSALGCLP